jgi:biotin transport system ATP-binding protein
MAAPITLTQASYAAQGKPILHDLTLTLTEARIGILGQNGSGKTTLLRLLAGLIAPTQGTVRIGQTDPAKDRKAALTQIGILFQNPDHQILFPTVEEELAFGLTQQNHPNPAQAVAALLAQENRTHWAKAPTHTLSQGQRHYLCLLSILLMNPQTLLLDEPFAGLDLPTQTRLKRRLNTLPQQTITITHDPASVTEADRILWLDQGRLRADGPPATVLPLFSAEMARLGATDADTGLPC